MTSRQPDFPAKPSPCKLDRKRNYNRKQWTRRHSRVETRARRTPAPAGHPVPYRAHTSNTRDAILILHLKVINGPPYRPRLCMRLTLPCVFAWKPDVSHSRVSWKLWFEKPVVIFVISHPSAPVVPQLVSRMNIHSDSIYPESALSPLIVLGSLLCWF